MSIVPEWLFLFGLYAIPAFVGCAIAFLISRRLLSVGFLAMYLLPPVLWIALEYAGYVTSFRPVIKSLANLVEFFYFGVAAGLLAIVAAILDRRGVSSPKSLRVTSASLSLALAASSWLFFPSLPE